VCVLCVFVCVFVSACMWCVRMWVSISAPGFVHVCFYVFMHMYIRVYIRIHRGVCVCAHTHTHAHASTHSCIHTHKCCSILQYVCCRVTLRCGEKRQLVKDLRIVSASASLVRFSNLAPCSRTTELVGPQAYGLRLMLVIFGVSGCLSILMFLTPLAEVTP